MCTGPLFARYILIDLNKPLLFKFHIIAVCYKPSFAFHGIPTVGSHCESMFSPKFFVIEIFF